MDLSDIIQYSPKDQTIMMIIPMKCKLKVFKLSNSYLNYSKKKLKLK